MTNYELMLILNPNISEEDRKNSLENIKSLLTKNEGKIKKEDIWWERKLAYKINSSEKWFYVLFDLEIEWKILSNITREINLDKNIWRHMFVKKNN